MDFREKIIVKRKRGNKRKARGFSREELGKVGISLKQALKLKLPIDLRRRSINEENVDFLKQLQKTKRAKHRKAKSKDETS
jgi:ribosomal protein L13E